MIKLYPGKLAISITSVLSQLLIWMRIFKMRHGGVMFLRRRRHLCYDCDTTQQRAIVGHKAVGWRV